MRSRAARSPSTTYSQLHLARIELPAEDMARLVERVEAVLAVKPTASAASLGGDGELAGLLAHLGIEDDAQRRHVVRSAHRAARARIPAPQPSSSSSSNNNNRRRGRPPDAVSVVSSNLSTAATDLADVSSLTDEQVNRDPPAWRLPQPDEPERAWSTDDEGRSEGAQESQSDEDSDEDSDAEYSYLGKEWMAELAELDRHA